MALIWEPVVNFFVNVLLLIYKYLGGNFGVAIILFTILIRLATHPLMSRQIKSGAKMAEFQQSKQWQDIQKKYKGDKEKLAQEQFRLQKELGVNPFASCLPSLIQLPILFALYQSVVRAMAATPGQLLILTHAVWPFDGLANIIPINSKFLWMNLGQPERVFIFGVGIPMLAILAAITTYVQSKVTMPPPADPKDQTAAMNNMMTMYMPLFMGWITYTLASGLALYIILGNIIGIAQYAWLGKVNWKALLPGKKPALQTQQAGRKNK
jgi:YidC/Oxa1 family membrane protein insertase